MGSNHGHAPTARAAGPTLYLESNKLDPTDAFCTEIFGDTEDSEYRVVQLTSSRSFDSLHETLDVQLEKIHDPSEAAVIIMSPHAEEDTAHTKVGADVPLHGFWVDPQDLTGISVAFSRLIEHWEDTPGETKICLRNLESLFPYHDTDMVYRFLNSVLATLQGASMEVHAHIRPSVTDDGTLELLSSLFTHIVGPTEPTRTRETAIDSDGRAVKSSSGPARAEERRATAESESRAHGGTAMSAGEIDTFLESTGHGILVFDGSPPYAIPMSYGYDADERRVYMQLSDYEGSEKQTRLEASARVSFIVARYARSDRWRSVVIDGRLTPLAESTVDRSDILEVYAQSDIATLDVFTEDSSNISFDWYVLEPDDLSGRQSINSL